MKPFIPLCLAVLLTPALAFAQTTIVDDSWVDGGRNNGADPLDTDWWYSTASAAIEVGTGYLGLVGSRGIHGTFTSQALNVGDTLTATVTFLTPATVGTGSGGFRFGLFDTTGKPGLAADISSSGTSANAVYNNLSGYMMDFDINLAAGGENVSFRERTNILSGQLMATTGDYSLFSGGGDPYKISANTSYTGVMSVTRTAAGLDLTGTLYQGATQLSTYTVSDTSATATTFGMLGFHKISGVLGSATTVNTPDNGVDFTNIKIEYLAVPEPSSAALLLGGMLVLGCSFRRKA